MSATHYSQRTSRRVSPHSTDPVVAIEQATERGNPGIPTQPFPDLVTAQYAAWRRCLYRETRSNADLEQFAGLVARLEREGASR